ncbi:DUF2079 domain-containing protein [Desulfatirhabdium butyrativorans]|uniref:DUF2079 domain-containing protein n=1 Tax=Desulfatirhabdium butyrativorans TaxID=340467 RepID=UPI00146FBEA3|nr:DUF2079 domain-containing protein [Desulfatirhabdium butyrativorans]
MKWVGNRTGEIRMRSLLPPAILFTILIGFLAIVRHYSFESFEDLALFDQLFWNIRHGRGPVTTISGNMHLLFQHHFFGEHFSPILYLLAPLAGITKGPEALLITQAFLIGLATIPAGIWVSRRIGNTNAGLWAAWFWIAIPPLWVGALYDFHMDCLIPLFFFAFVLSMHQKKASAWLWAVLLVSVKEDASIYLFFAALVTGWLYDNRRTGIFVATASLVYALVVILIVIPGFSPTETHLLSNRMLTPANSGGFFAWLQAVLANPERWEALRNHLLHFGLFPVIGLFASLPWMVAIGIAWLSNDAWQSLITMHYPLMSYPLMFFAMIEGLRLWNRLFERHFPAFQRQALVFAILLISGSLLLTWSDARAPLDDVMRTASPVRALRTSESRRMLEAIPSGASVAATQTTLAHVARREKLFLMFEPMDAEHIVMQTYLPCEASYRPQPYREQIGYFLKNTARYQLAASTDHLLVFRADTSDTRPDRSWYFTDFIDSTELAGSEKQQSKDPDAINGLAAMFSEKTRNLQPMKFPKPLVSGSWNLHVRARSSCVSSPDSVTIQIQESDGGRLCGSGAIGAEGGDSYQITTVSSMFASGRDITVHTNVPVSCTLWIDRIWTEPIG